MAEALKNKQPLQMDGQDVMNEEMSTEEAPVQMTEGDLAKEELADIKKRAEKMSVAIEDQFIECSYTAEARKIHYTVGEHNDNSPIPPKRHHSNRSFKRHRQGDD